MHESDSDLKGDIDHDVDRKACADKVSIKRLAMLPRGPIGGSNHAHMFYTISALLKEA